MARWWAILIIVFLGCVGLLPFICWRLQGQHWLQELEADLKAQPFKARLKHELEKLDHSHSEKPKHFLAPPPAASSTPLAIAKHSNAKHSSALPLPVALSHPASSIGITERLEQTLISDAVTFVLTTWSGDKGGYPRVGMLVGSLQNFAAPGCIHELLIVTPAQDRPALEKRASAGFSLESRPTFPVRVITDEDALGSTGRHAEYEKLTPFAERKVNGGRGTNYRISMLLKLGAASQVHTRFYVLLDSDVFLKRHMSLEDLLPQGKALLQGKGGQQRGSWWESSGNLLGAEQSCSKAKVGGYANDFSIGVTPSILSTVVVAGLLKRLGGRGQWDLSLFKALSDPPAADWTEYTLYWISSCMSGTMEKYHKVVPGRHIYDERGFTELYSIADYPIDTVFNDKSSFFGVVQTVAGVSTKEVFEHIAPRLGVKLSM